MSNVTFQPVERLDDLLGGVQRFLEAEVIARHQEAGELLTNPLLRYGPDGRYRDEVLKLQREVRMASATAGYYSMFVPVELGGGGLGVAAMYTVWEEIFRRCGSTNWLGYQAVAHWTRGPSRLLQLLQPSIAERDFARLASGEQTMCFAMSEPDAGSDPWMMRTRAVVDGDGWLISGTKQWISNGANADFAVVFAVTDSAAAAERRGGITAFWVPCTSGGFQVNSVIPLFGHAGSHEAIVEMSDVAVGPDQVIGEIDHGFEIALDGVSLGRIYNAAKGVGLARWALALACDYVQHRQTFGHTLDSYQAVAFPLAESAMEIHAAHLVGLNCARLLDGGHPARKELAMAKAYSTEAGLRAVDRAMQVFGGMGFTNELGLAEAWQQLRVVCVADGSAEIMRRQIAGRLFKGDLDL